MSENRMPELPTPCVFLRTPNELSQWADQMHAYARAYAAQAVAAEREACAVLCEALSSKHWDAFKRGSGPERADPHYQGLSMGADECEAAIRTRSQS